MKYYNQLPQNNLHKPEEEVPDGLSHWVLDVFQVIFWLIAVGCLLLVYSLIPKEEVDGAIESINKNAPQVTARISDTVGSTLESTKKSPEARFGAWYLSKEFKSSARALKSQKPKLQQSTNKLLETVESSTAIAPPKDDLIAINWTGKDAEIAGNNQEKKKKDKKAKKKKKSKKSKKDYSSKNTRDS